jgi:hypothetical protein
VLLVATAAAAVAAPQQHGQILCIHLKQQFLS